MLVNNVVSPPPFLSENTSKKASISKVLLDTIHSYGVDKVFLVPGAHITPLMVELENHEHITPIVALHELGAAYMAIGYARASGKPGVVLSIGGPGASYMMGAAITAKADRVPVIFITGDIPASHHGLGEFQDSGPDGTNDSKIYREALGRSHVCYSPEDLPNILDSISGAFHQRHPIHIQLPIDVQRLGCTATPQRVELPAHKCQPIASPRLPHQTKIVLFLGQFVLDRVDSAQLALFVERNQFAVVTDLTARGIISEESRHSFGFVGFNSDPRALISFNGESENSAEIVLTVGVKKETLRRYLGPSVQQSEWTVDELISLLNSSFPIVENKELLAQRVAWIDSQVDVKLSFSEPSDNESYISYRSLFKQLSQKLPKHTRYCLDAGQVRRAGSILLRCTEAKTLIQSDVLSPMGHGVCAAIGVKFAMPNAPVVALFGDGSMRMHGIEISTAVKYDLPIIFIMLDNQSYASILSRGQMESYAELPKTDWKLFAQSLGIPCTEVANAEDFSTALESSTKSNTTSLLWVKVGKLLDAELNGVHELEYKNWLTSEHIKS